MKPRINIITLAVDNVSKALLFYRDTLGLPTEGMADGADHIAFELQNNLSLVLYPRTEIARLVNEPLQSKSSLEFILTYITEDKAEVDAMLKKVALAGGTVLGAPHEHEWGYVGYFKDPDGHLWEIIWNPDFETGL